MIFGNSDYGKNLKGSVFFFLAPQGKGRRGKAFSQNHCSNSLVLQQHLGRVC
jgi:hypothetical protein